MDIVTGITSAGLTFMVPRIMILFMKMTNRMQLCRIIYCFLTALHVSSDIFTHHQEHLNCNDSFWYFSRMSSPDGVMGELELSSNSLKTPASNDIREKYQKLSIKFRCS